MFRIVLFVLSSLFCLSSQTAVQDAFKRHQIVPDVVSVAPEKLLNVTYEKNLVVNLGNELKPSEVKDAPVIHWEAEKNDLYCLIMTDPDAPSRAEPAFREIKHLLVLNIPGNDISKGRMIAEYRGSGPPAGTGLHRYIFLVYKQTQVITDDMPTASKESRNGRIGFKTQDFASKYNLGAPVAGNFFQAQYEDNKRGLANFKARIEGKLTQVAGRLYHYRGLFGQQTN